MNCRTDIGKRCRLWRKELDGMPWWSPWASRCGICPSKPLDRVRDEAFRALKAAMDAEQAACEALQRKRSKTRQRKWEAADRAVQAAMRAYAVVLAERQGIGKRWRG
jgi:hypothetical protein